MKEQRKAKQQRERERNGKLSVNWADTVARELIGRRKGRGKEKGKKGRNTEKSRAKSILRSR